MVELKTKRELCCSFLFILFLFFVINLWKGVQLGGQKLEKLINHVQI